jgi:ADP-dependent NAD(P)H-hydrate dehydratase / NAD(P)H-hydrate epimerase
MKVVTAETMRRAEQVTMGDYNIPGQVLMETAGRACADVLLAEFGSLPGTSVSVIAGKGNNGGDGFVIARCLARLGWHVRVYVLAARHEIAGDAATNLALLDPSFVVFCLSAGDLLAHEAVLRSSSIIVDALFGIGLTKDVVGIHAEAVACVNDSGRPVMAVDIPSGVAASTGKILGCAVKADLTVTFARAKFGHALYPGRFYTGKLVTVDIGVPEEVSAAMNSCEFLDCAAVSPRIRRRDRCGHKGDYGHCLIVAGSTGKTGAAALAANSAVRTGSGLVSLAVPASLNAILEIKTTEAMTCPLHDQGMGVFLEDTAEDIERLVQGKSACAIGPGISRDPGTVRLVQRLIRKCAVPLLIDADGLNAVAYDVSILQKKLSSTVVLTPHPGEMARLTGLSIAAIEDDRMTAARDFSILYGVYVVLKGASTIITAPDGSLAINGSGNPGMASGGMGDVLTGIIASLLGQGYQAMDACCIGVFLHGLAGDLVGAEKGELGICATDVQERIPYAYKFLTEARSS